ncbi:gamma-glutamyltransferase [Ferrovibrio sp.]|uniref:gamma-glutamyltransferase n=1 Tax=Ferrovibrio sp. TaxID=1917215 RepID=UPI001B5870A2|nr:gamma-glutamyltransferase [Ferrovibrio sp.]MBP7064246.1 gamma-glutamyltransferase [Ferrovibrio sp.]
MPRWLPAFLLLILVLPARVLPTWAQPAPEASTGRQDKAEALATRQMVVAAHPLAAEAGLAMLRQGGTALDAAVAVQMMLTLVEPQSSGIGGGALLLYWDNANKQIHAYDGREMAPAAARPERFLKPDGTPLPFREAVPSGLSTGVPGAVAALHLAHQAHGKLPWASLPAPAITAAEQGFTVTPRLAGLLAREQRLRQEPAAAALYYPGGEPLKAGTVLRNPALAASLRHLANDGAAALQHGPLAEAMLAALAARGSDMTAADLANYQAKPRAPLCGSFRLFKLCGFGPPSSGGVAVLQILKLIEQLDPSPAPGLAIADLHRLVEASRLAFADRNLYLADSDFVPVPLAGLLDPGYLTDRAKLVRMDASLGIAQPGEPPGRRGQRPGLWPHDGPPGTSHVSIVDAWGNAVSMTTTIEDAFGARLLVGGFLLNNQLTDFSFLPSQDGRPVANRVEAGKRPRSSMAPFLVFDPQGALLGVLGSPGGSQIIGYVAQSLLLLLDKGLGPQAAVALPHIGSRNGPTEIEHGADPAWAEGLGRLGHRSQSLEMTSGLHVIWRRTGAGAGQWAGGADPRREGVALGD